MTESEQTQPEDLVYRLRKRAEIRRQISTRKSVQEGQPDRISDLLEEAADEIDYVNGLLDDIRVLVITNEMDEEYTKFDLINELAQVLRNQK